jgi:hypothetical protein
LPVTDGTAASIIREEFVINVSLREADVPSGKKPGKHVREFIRYGIDPLLSGNAVANSLVDFGHFLCQL